MSLLNLLLVAASALLASAGLIWLRLRFAEVGLDQPGHRSLHSRPTPHGGGIGVVLAAVAVGVWAGAPPVWLVGVGMLALLSLIDDWRHLPFWLRLLVHLAVSAVVVFLHPAASTLASLVVLVLIAWSINAYNFMDGSDGLAGSMAVVGFGAYAIGFAFANDAVLSALSAALAGGAAGFLIFNWHPARIFMGDVGSVPLGFLASGLGWYGYWAGVWPGWFPLLVFAPFLLDASVTLLKRLLRRERVWEAHRDHYYQRMVRLGESHAAVCVRWLRLMLVGGAWAVTLMLVGRTGWGWGVTLAWTGLLLLMGHRVDVRWNNKNK